MRKMVLCVFVFCAAGSIYTTHAEADVDSLKALLPAQTGNQRIGTLYKLSSLLLKPAPHEALHYARELDALTAGTDPEAKTKAMLAVAFACFYAGMPDSAHHYNQKALACIKQAGGSPFMGRHLRLCGNLYYTRGNADSASICYTQAAKHAEESGMLEDISLAYNNLGKLAHEANQYYEAVTFYKHALHIVEGKDLLYVMESPLINLANMYVKLGEYNKAIFYSHKILDLYRGRNNNHAICNAYNTLGDAYAELEETRKALGFYQKAMGYARELDNPEEIAVVYNNLAEIYLGQGALLDAEQYFRKFLNLKQNWADTAGVALAYNNLAAVYLQRGEYGQVSEYILKSIAMNEKLGASLSLINNYLIRGELQLKTGHHNAARIMFGKAEELADSIELRDKVDIYKSLVGLYEKQRNHREAFEYQKKLQLNKDHLLSQDKLRIKQAIEARYNYERQETALNMLEKDNRLKDMKIRRQRLIGILLVLGVVVLLFGTLGVYFVYRQKRRALKQLKETFAKLKEKQNELEAANKQLRMLSEIANQTQLSICVTGLDGNVKWANRAFRKLYGYSRRRIQRGLHLHNVRPESTVQKNLAQVAQTGNPVTFVEAIRPKRLQDRFIQTSMNPIRDADGALTDVILVDADITREKLVQAQLEKALNTREKFLSIIAHDLKNPFSSIIGLAQLTLDRFEHLNNVRKYSYIKNILLASQQGYNLLTNLLYWTRAQAGGMQASPQAFQFCDLIKQNFAFLKIATNDKKIKLKQEAEEALHVWADENMVDTVLRNLLSNAVKFTPENGSITVKACHEDTKIRVYVIDSGDGISEEMQKGLFQDNSFSTRGTRNESGTGMGLVICKEFIEKNNGEIGVESQPGQGSTFWFSLPAAE